MTTQPLDYSSGPNTKAGASRLGAVSLFLSVGGIVVGLGLIALGKLLGIGARGGGPGVLVALVGLIFLPLLNIAAFITGIVALFRRGRSRTMAFTAIVLSCASIILLVVLLNQ